MPKGHWSFIHEWVIYEYVKTRAEEGTLRFKLIICTGKLLGKPKWIRVSDVLPITGTSFPDIQGIQLKGENIFRPAEVKFTTSLFNYHEEEKYELKFQEFINKRGFILVAAHDYPPDTLTAIYPDIDIYEIEIEDFVTFCRENFSRLLNKQIKSHTITRVWLMYQGPNFNEGTDKILPARDSMVWCPTENLTGFDLARGDRILFYKTSGIDTQKLQRNFLINNHIDEKWLLKELYLAEVNSKIFSREEYYQYKKEQNAKQFWKNDPKKNGSWRWNRIFEFKKVKSFDVNKSMHQLYNIESSSLFVKKALEGYCFGKSREISLKDYRNLLEVLL